MRKLIYIIAWFAWLFSACASPSASQPVDTPTALQASTDEPRFTPPPGAETPEIKSLIDKAQASLARGAGASTLLADSAYMTAHEWPRFRKLIREYAPSNQLTIVTREEPGEPLLVTGTLRNKQGAPIKGALVYAYHTSAKGWYSDKAPHVSGNSGDEKHARLFGYLITDEDGKYELRTIRPAGYPHSTLPAHIHIEIEALGNEPPTLISEILFADDPRLTSEARERSLREGLVIFPVTRTSGEWRVQADFQMR